MSKAPSSERTTAALDAAAVRVLAYAKQEREEAIAAAMLHVEILASEKIPRLALRYSNYLAPLAKKELLKGLQGGVSVATEFLSTTWS